MKLSQHYQSGNLVLPSALLFHFKDLFPSADDFLVWQFFYFQNTSKVEDLAPSQIAQAIGATVEMVNQSIENLQTAGLLEFKTIELAGEIEMIFDAMPALDKLEELLSPKEKEAVAQPTNELKALVGDFERELGRLLSPFELEELQKTVADDRLPAELIREALKEAVFNGKTNWKYIQAILRNWRKEGITSVVQVEAKRAERELPQTPTAPLSQGTLSLWKD